MNYSVHETSIIDNGAVIGENTRVWHWVHVCSGAKVGRHCSLGQNVFIGGRAVIGDYVKIQNNVSVFDDVILEDYVFCGPGVVFTNVYNPRSEIPRKNEYLKTIVKKGATLGANSTIVCGNTIGEYAFVGAGSVVKNNIPSFALMVGVPSRQVGWMSRFGERLDLPVKGTAHVVCSKTGDEYELHDGHLKMIKSGIQRG